MNLNTAKKEIHLFVVVLTNKNDISRPYFFFYIKKEGLSAKIIEK